MEAQNVSLFPLCLKVRVSACPKLSPFHPDRRQEYQELIFLKGYCLFLPQIMIPLRFRSESSSLSRLLSTGVANTQTLLLQGQRSRYVSTPNKSVRIQLSFLLL